MSDLFPLPLPVVVFTGEFESGKTLAILTTGAPMERVLLYDNELSAEIYARQYPFKRIDLTNELSKENEIWTNQQFYERWRDHIATIKDGEYDVIGIDPAERIEAGMVDWVRKNPSFFGHTPNQYAQISSLIWSDMKDLWARHIFSLKAKCQMVVITMHMRNVYVGGRPTAERERKGKDILSELATLELTLSRKPGQRKPSALVNKSRMFMGDLVEDPDNLIPMFDKWIPDWSWNKIRWYMEHGTDPTNPSLPPERSEEEKEDERLRLRAEIARAQSAAIEAGIPLPGLEEPPGGGSKCPVCNATASPSSDTGHAPWCKIEKNGSRYDERKKKDKKGG